MLDIQRIREDPDGVMRAAAAKRDHADIRAILAMDGERRRIIHEVEGLKNSRNRCSKEIAALKKDRKDASARIAEMKTVSERIKELDASLKEADDSIYREMITVPNIPHASVPHGADENDNVVVREWGQKPRFDFEPGDHLRIGTALDIIDFARGAKVAGTGFPVYKGNGALLERALVNFMLDTHVGEHGYTEIFPPFLANRSSHFGTGQLPKSEEQMYFIPEDGLFAIPTAEVPVTNLHRDEILEEADLPLRYCAYSACFRREAGSYGKDTKGFLRVHQFNKVELVKFVPPSDSYTELQALRGDAEGILRALGLHYQVMELCDADLSFAAAKCFDINIWAPAEKKYLEVSSCSNFEEFQARRMNIRFRPKSGGKPCFVHTLNGSGVATPRLMVALLETCQTREGTVRIPEVLRPYMHGLTEIA